MKGYKYLLDKNGLEVSKVTLKGNSVIITTPLDQFVIKKNNGIKIYDYLLSRGFDYFPKIIDYDEDYILFEYINDINYDEEEKAEDFIKLLSFLHSKTSYYKEFSSIDYKEYYNNLLYQTEDLINYYTNLSNIIETKEYMSPAEYLIIRNISIIFSCLNYIKESLNNLIKNINTTKKRVVTLYNNINIDNLLKDKDSIYLTNFSKTKVDSPVFDLYNFYKKYSLKFNFSNLLSKYNKINPLTEEENILLNILISIPDKIIIDNNINNIKNIKESINKIYKTLEVLNSKEEETRKTHENENNE